MKYTIWTIVNVIIFMVNLALTVICAVMYCVVRDTSNKCAKNKMYATRYYYNLKNFEKEEEEEQ